MDAKTKIEWTDTTWNPIRHVKQGRKKVTVKLDEQILDQPHHWRRTRKIFVCSMVDLFGGRVADDMIKQIFAVMSSCPQHIFQVLTKCPVRMHRLLARHAPLPNVWLGVSVENQATTDERIPVLLKTPAAIRFVSAEPLLGPIDLRHFTIKPEKVHINALTGRRFFTRGAKIDWLIIGGESGPGAMPIHPDWVRALRDQCRGNGVAFFFKQWGAHSATMARVSKHQAGNLLDGRQHHDFPGWRECDDGCGGESVCAHCGIGAMSHDMRTL